jgi:hypothetical protein
MSLNVYSHTVDPGEVDPAVLRAKMSSRCGPGVVPDDAATAETA